jgi:hypothetical protein
MKVNIMQYFFTIKQLPPLHSVEKTPETIIVILPHLYDNSSIIKITRAAATKGAAHGRAAHSG